jgi:hypothetical protein
MTERSAAAGAVRHCSPVLRRVVRLWRGLMAAGLIAAVQPLPENDMPVPVPLQVPMLAKILEFDRNLPQRPGTELVIVVAYQEGYRASRVASSEFSSTAHATSIQGRPVRIVMAEIGDGSGLVSALRKHGAAVVYLAPLRAIDVAPLAASVTGAGVIAMTGVPEYASRGVPVAIGLRAGRPLIRINLSAARAAGADFGAQLLKLAELVD